MAYVKGKDKNEILEAMVGTAEPGSPVHEQQKMGIVVRATEDLESALASVREALNTLRLSMEANANSSDVLAQRVHWLNVVLAVATVAGTLIAGYAAVFGGS